MPVHDAVFKEINPIALFAIIAATLLTVYFGVLKCCYNSFSLKTVLEKYEERKKLEHEYNMAYQRREDLMFHKDWAKSRGDFSDSKRMETELTTIEKELDALDDKLGYFDSGDKQI